MFFPEVTNKTTYNGISVIFQICLPTLIAKSLNSVFFLKTSSTIQNIDNMVMPDVSMTPK